VEETDFIWMNGKMVKWNDAKIHILTHTLHYGTGVFEGIRCYKTSQGPAIFRLKDHCKRLMKSAKIMQIKTKYSQADYEKAINEIVKVNKLEECYIRPLIYYGYGKMGVDTVGAQVDSSIAAFPFPSYLGKEGLEKGIGAKISSFRRHNINSTMTKSKTCGNYVNSTLAKMEALNAGYQEAIMLDTEGYVCECSAENIFIVRDGELVTPPLLNVLNGITRRSIIEIAKDEKIKVKEEFFSRDQLYTADEVFMTGTAAEVTPIIEIDHRTIGTGTPGEITKKLQKKFFDIVKGKEAKYNKWLTFVK